MTPSPNPYDEGNDDCAVVDRVEKLAQTWQDLKEKGDASSFEDLCAGQPELIPAVKEWLAKVDQMEARLSTQESVGSTLNGQWNADHILAPAQSSDELGRLGNYRILRLIGQGGMGRVYLAEDMKLKRRVAIKVLIRGGDKRFQREAETLAAVDHDHIVSIYQMDEERGTMYLAMPYLQGETLDARLRTRGRLPVADCVRIAKQICLGLAAAHQLGVIHRDIKPSNIWLEKVADRVKILDFGLARCEGMETLLSQEGAVVGTPGYMAPEQVQGENADHRSDLFSLGCVLYQMISGQAPFAKKDILSTLRALEMETPEAPAVRAPGTPDELSNLTMKLLAKKPDERPTSAEAVVCALDEIEEHLKAADVRPSMLLPVATPVKPPAPEKRRALPWLIAATIVAACVCTYLVTRPRTIVEQPPTQDLPPVVAVKPDNPPVVSPVKPVQDPPKIPEKTTAIETPPKSKTVALAERSRPGATYDIGVSLPDAKVDKNKVWLLPADPQSFRVDVKVDHPASVGIWLWHRSSHGGVTQLFPNASDQDNWFDGKTNRSIPSNKKYQLKMRETKGAGSDVLLVVASSTRWKWNPARTEQGLRVFAKEEDLAKEIERDVLVFDGKTSPRSALIQMPVRLVQSDYAP